MTAIQEKFGSFAGEAVEVTVSTGKTWRGLVRHVGSHVAQLTGEGGDVRVVVGDRRDPSACHFVWGDGALPEMARVVGVR